MVCAKLFYNVLYIYYDRIYLNTRLDSATVNAFIEPSNGLRVIIYRPVNISLHSLVTTNSRVIIYRSLGFRNRTDENKSIHRLTIKFVLVLL